MQEVQENIRHLNTRLNSSTLILTGSPYGKQQIAPVGADAWQGDGRAVSIRVIRARKEQVTRTSVSLRVYSVALGVKKDGRNEFVSTGYDFQNVAGFGNFVAGFTDNVAVK